MRERKWVDQTAYSAGFPSASFGEPSRNRKPLPRGALDTAMRNGSALRYDVIPGVKALPFSVSDLPCTTALEHAHEGIRCRPTILNFVRPQLADRREGS